MGIRSYRTARNRRVPQPGTPGGKVNGVNVAAFEFRGEDGDVINVSIHVMGANGELQSAELQSAIGERLPIAQITIQNASNPGEPASALSATVIAAGIVEIEIGDLPPEDVGTLLIEPMAVGWGDRAGRVFGGIYCSIPANP